MPPTNHDSNTTSDKMSTASNTNATDPEKAMRADLPPESPQSLNRSTNPLCRNLSPTGPGRLLRGNTVGSDGFSDLVRQRSPPAVSLFGGVSPDGEDFNDGLSAVYSFEEEEERIGELESKGPDPYSVKFEPGEKINPKNWSVGYRWYLTGFGSLLVLNATFASSAPSGITQGVIKQFHIGAEVATLCISLFVAGYCVGPLLWGPLSETYGRRPIFILSFVVYTGMQIGCALAPNVAALLVFRFIGGTFAAAPLTNSGALLADIWDGDHRGQAMALFGLAPFAGPSIGPIVAGYIQVSGASWRWVYWVLTIFAGICTLGIIFTLPETYAPIILTKKARMLRKETGDDRWYAPFERKKTNFKARVHDILFKPFIMLALEPMLQVTTIYMAFVYGVIYLLFMAFPIVFMGGHGFNAGESGLVFLSLFIGGVITCILFVLFFEPHYQRLCKRLAPERPKPETRLYLCMVASFALVIGMFWFGWTSGPEIHWAAPLCAGIFIGIGAQGMFTSLFNYLVDVYLWSAASALSSNTVVRSAFGAGFPLFATQMYNKLGTQWASSLLGFIALALAPVPFALYKWGPWLRARSKFTPDI